MQEAMEDVKEKLRKTNQEYLDMLKKYDVKSNVSLPNFSR